MTPGAPNPLDYGWWLASRSAGVLSLVLVSVSVIIGLMMANNLPRRPGAKRTLLGVHESTAIAGLVAIGVHGVTLLGDQWLKAAPADLAVPFALSYRPGFTGLGVIAGYLAVFLGLSFYARTYVGNRRWRSVHRATVLVWLLGVIHAIGAGTDGGQTWMLVLIAVTGVPILALFTRRMMLPRGGTPARRAGGAPPRRARPEAPHPLAPHPDQRVEALR